MENLDDKTEENRVNPQENTISKNASSEHIGSEKEWYNTFANIREIDADIDELSSISGKSVNSTNSINVPNSNFMHALINFLKSFIGIGVLTLPNAIDNWGIVLGGFSIIGCGIMWCYGVHMLTMSRRKLLKSIVGSQHRPYYLPELDEERQRLQINVANNDNVSQNSYPDTERILLHQHKIKTFADIGREWYGTWGESFVNFMLFVQQIGIIIVYFYMLEDYFPSFIIIIVIAPVWMFWNLKGISYISLFALSCIMIALSVFLVVSFTDINRNSKSNVKYFDIYGFPLFFGVCVIQFEGNNICLQIENSMSHPKQFVDVNKVGMLIIIILGVLIAVVGYITYVDDAEEIIINSLYHSTLKDMCAYLYCIALATSIPLQVSPLADETYRMTLLDSRVKLFRENPTIKYYISAFLTVWICGSIALCIPSLEEFFNIIGAFAGIFTVCIFPVMFYNKAYENEISKLRYYIHWTMSILIFIAGMVSIVVSFTS